MLVLKRIDRRNEIIDDACIQAFLAWSPSVSMIAAIVILQQIVMSEPGNELLDPEDANNDPHNDASDDPNLETGEPLETLETRSRPVETFMEKFRRKFGAIPKTVAACFIMLCLGIVLLVLPTAVPSINKSSAIGLYIIGALLLIPSVYAAYILYNVFNDTPGFDLDGLPIYDDLI